MTRKPQQGSLAYLVQFVLPKLSNEELGQAFRKALEEGVKTPGWGYRKMGAIKQVVEEVVRQAR